MKIPLTFKYEGFDLSRQPEMGWRTASPALAECDQQRISPLEILCAAECCTSGGAIVGATISTPRGFSWITFPPGACLPYDDPNLTSRFVAWATLLRDKGWHHERAGNDFTMICPIPIFGSVGAFAEFKDQVDLERIMLASKPMSAATGTDGYLEGARVRVEDFGFYSGVSVQHEWIRSTYIFLEEEGCRACLDPSFISCQLSSWMFHGWNTFASGTHHNFLQPQIAYGRERAQIDA